MKKIRGIFWGIVFVLLLTGCEPLPEKAADEEETKLELPQTQKEELEEKHSLLYDARYRVEDVVKYFNEVVLKTEYSTGDGDGSLVQKWDETLYYTIVGEPTDKDIEVLDKLFQRLNEVEGFPGIERAEGNDEANVMIGFYDRDTFYEVMGEFIQYEEADGAVQYWYDTDMNNIHTMQIGYRTDIAQDIRNSILLEEIINGLGITDTEMREDSIVYQWSSDTKELSDMDWLLVKLLYNKSVRPGMQAEECRRVIETLYY